jgi:D-arabinose 1-dehydrogenase
VIGKALIAPYESTNTPFPREDYFIVTKVGRIAGSEFNYSAAWVYKSIKRSITRLNTSYLDVVYCHDVEFVTAAEVLTAVKELKRIRDTEGTIKYIGISGYPVSVLCDLAELILKETGEPLDCVMSYANFTLQNRRLKSEGLSRLKAAGVDVVPNASILGMGLLRSGGVPEGSLGDWHPAPEGLRAACTTASKYCHSIGEKLEVVAIRWALETWLIEGESVGSKGDPASGLKWKRETIEEVGGRKLGVSVMGVSNLQELEETMRVWRSILDGLEGGRETSVQAGRWEGDHEWSLKRRDEIRAIASSLWEKFGKWQDFAWASPGAGYVRVQSAAERD